MKPSRFAANRNRNYSGKNTVTMQVDMSAVDAMLAEIEGDIHEAVRPAAQAAAEVYYKQVLKNVAAIGTVTGTLGKSIYQSFSKDNSVAAPGGGYVSATYHVSWRTSDAALDDKGQPIRTGMPVAPHAHLIEFGYIQRYASYIGKDGNWHTAVRPEMRGKKKPKRNASQAEKDAYYVLRPGGPVQHPARPFLRPAYTQAREAAVEAALAKIAEVFGK